MAFLWIGSQTTVADFCYIEINCLSRVLTCRDLLVWHIPIGQDATGDDVWHKQITLYCSFCFRQYISPATGCTVVRFIPSCAVPKSPTEQWLVWGCLWNAWRSRGVCSWASRISMRGIHLTSLVSPLPLLRYVWIYMHLSTIGQVLHDSSFLGFFVNWKGEITFLEQ